MKPTPTQIPRGRQGLEQALETAPRRVPLALRVALWLGAELWFGWLPVLIGGAFVVDVLANIECISDDFDGSAPAEITKIEQTTKSEAIENSEDHAPIFAVHYRFTSSHGVVHTGTSYTTDTVFPHLLYAEYDSQHPERSRIERMRTAPYDRKVLLVVLVPMAGFAIVFVGMRRGRRRYRLLRHGIEARARLTQRLTRPRSRDEDDDDKPLVTMHFEFTCAAGQQRRFHIETQDPERFEDDDPEPMLYDPEEPSRVALLDELPGVPRIIDGQLVMRWRLGPILPVLGVVAGLAVAVALVLSDFV